MRKLSIILAIVLLALAVLVLLPQAEPFGAILPIASAVTAVALLIVILADRPKAETGRAVTEPVEPAAAPPPPIGNDAQANAEVVSFLATLQDKGRLVDFLMDDVAGYSDAQVAAAARVVHAGCKSALLEHFGIRPVRDEQEGSRVSVPAGYASDEYRLVGRISGEAPFSGTLIHRGWKTEWVKLPRVLRRGGDRLPTVAPAEIELK
jgi:hypothetical protein